jgi:predicted Rossmann fold nucleotide-binding protein DprA/Smf involved in DNA uptake
MERNALLYALSELSIVCQARYREGGSWHGAVEASRRRLCRLAVRWAPGDPAARALVSLGAFPMSSAEDLELALAFEGLQPPLIDSYRVS